MLKILSKYRTVPRKIVMQTYSKDSKKWYSSAILEQSYLEQSFKSLNDLNNIVLKLLNYNIFYILSYISTVEDHLPLHHHEATLRAYHVSSVSIVYKNRIRMIFTNDLLSAHNK